MKILIVTLTIIISFSCVSFAEDFLANPAHVNLNLNSIANNGPTPYLHNGNGEENTIGDVNSIKEQFQLKLIEIKTLENFC